jgi:O-antigen ligase
MSTVQPQQVWASETRGRAEQPDLWYLLAVATLTFALLDGFGAYQLLITLTPMKYVGLLLTMLFSTLLLSPRGSSKKVFLPLPAVCFVSWWVASYLWETNRAGWVSVTTRDLSTLVAIVVLAQVLGAREFIRVLLRSGYIAIGLIAVALLVQPGLAYDVAGAAPGLHGGFIHKNTMAPCLVVTAAAVLCFHPDRRFRRMFVALVAVLLFLGQTTTGLATLAAVVFLNWVFMNYLKVVQRLGRSAGSLMIAATLLFTVVAAQTFSSLVRLSGKDLTFSNRTVIWQGVVDAIHQRPWLGFGYGVWQNIWVDPILTINLNNGFLVAEAHSAPLDLMLRLGITGLVLYLVQLVATARVGWRGLKADDPYGRMSLLFVAILILVGFSESLTAFGVWPALMIVFGVNHRVSRPAPRRRRSQAVYLSGELL